MKYILLPLFAILLLLNSCKKDLDPTVFSGYVKELSTDLPLSNVLVTLKIFDAPSDPKIITTQTDINGFYSFSLNTIEKRYYYVSAEKQNYIEQIEFGSPIGLKIFTSENNTKNLILGKAATVEINLLNNENNYDYISLICSARNFDVGINNYSMSSRYTIEDSQDSTIYAQFLYFEDMDCNIHWATLPDNNHDTIVELFPLDTTYLTIEY